MTTRYNVGVDANTVSQLHDEIHGLKSPGTVALAQQRAAMYRAFISGDVSLYVFPTPTRECSEIPDVDRRTGHEDLMAILLLDGPPPRDPVAVERRARALQVHHDDLDDCRVVAEVEAAGLSTLLTYDFPLIRHLGPHTTVQLVHPTDFLATHPLGSPRWTRAMPQLA